MVSEEIRKRVGDELDRIERDEDVRILYACESGSRAWGFPSRDSDYDVRFLYLHPARWYLRVRPGRDVIERPIDDELDVSGWDLKKALGLLRKSNPPLLEWLQSPIVYREQREPMERIRALASEYYSPSACFYHYFHMAERNHREYLRGDEVWLKKYFYVLRPVLACRWIERGLGTVPTVFAELIDRVAPPGPFRVELDRLLERKRSGDELDRGPRIPAISDFIDAEMARLSAVPPPPARRTDWEPLDAAFSDCLRTTFGGASSRAT